MPTRSHLSNRPALSALAALLALGTLAGSPVQAQSLIGSKASMIRQDRAARQHDYTYLRTSAQVNAFVRQGRLVRLSGNSGYQVASASFPYARPEVKTFVERLGSQYKSACGERLIVTSLTRPTTRQPRNASPLSVHPTGMAVDFRRSGRPACRAFLEKTLLTLEGRSVLEATKENHPPHYHVSLFPQPYSRYLLARGAAPEPRSQGSPKSQKSQIVLTASKSYRVRSGDSLWDIARRNGASVAILQQANSVSASGLKAGQVIAIPSAR